MVVRTESWYRERLERSGVPEYMHDGYVLYLLHGIPPGHFLTAVLSNDLREACARADETNQRTLYRHVAFLWNHAPASCWGSEERVMDWVKQAGEARQSQEGEPA